MKSAINRRSFVKNGLTAAGVATVGSGLLVNGTSALAEGSEKHSGRLSRGDAALLRFAAAAEILETDFWVQYNELGGIQDSEESQAEAGIRRTRRLFRFWTPTWPSTFTTIPTTNSRTRTSLMHIWLRREQQPVSLEQFRTLPGSTATGSSGKLRLTNLMQLTLDTSWWTRYRSQHQQPRSRSELRFPAGDADAGGGTAHGHSANR